MSDVANITTRNSYRDIGNADPMVQERENFPYDKDRALLIHSYNVEYFKTSHARRSWFYFYIMHTSSYKNLSAAYKFVFWQNVEHAFIYQTVIFCLNIFVDLLLIKPRTLNYKMRYLK